MRLNETWSQFTEGLKVYVAWLFSDWIVWKVILSSAGDVIFGLLFFTVKICLILLLPFTTLLFILLTLVIMIARK